MSEQEIFVVKIPKDEIVVFEFEGLGVFAASPEALFESWVEFTKSFIKV